MKKYAFLGLASLALAAACGSGDESPAPAFENGADGGASGGDGGSGPSLDGGTDGDHPDASAPPTEYLSVAAGGTATCAVRKNDGKRRCWGANFSGTLLDGTTLSRELPTDAQPLPKATSALSLGDFLSCALFSDATVSCWGRHSLVGDGDASATPVGLTTPSGLAAGIKSISVRRMHACVVAASGAVQCWGDTSGGALGSASGPSVVAVPTTLTGVSDAASVTLAATHACVVTTGGTVTCWGTNSDGQLGDGKTTSRNTPATIAGLSSVTALAAGESHTCALSQAGGVKCWGKPSYVGASGSTGTSPVDVTGLSSGVTALVAGIRHTCALLQTGHVQCWGANYDGELGDGTTTLRNTPVDVVGLTDAVSLVAGDSHTCALRKNGTLACWGFDTEGQLGDGHAWETSPVAVPLASPVTRISSGWFAVAVLAGDALGWGNSPSNGGILLGAKTERTGPTPMTVLAGSDEVVFGYADGCARKGGSLSCWGANFAGEVGSGNAGVRPSPEQVQGLTAGVTAVARGGNHTCAIVAGGAKCWGENGNGELGDGTMSPRATPVDVAGATSGVSALSASSYRTCIVTAAGGVKCTGLEPGNGAPSSKSLVDVTGVSSGVTAIGSGLSVTCASLAGAVKCWGQGSRGELGDGSKTPSATTPVTVTGLAGATSLTGGLSHTCAVTPAGGVKCWGANTRGQLGDGTRDEHLTPVDVVGLSSGVAAVVAGAEHTCALTTAGVVKCWGRNALCTLGANCTGLVPVTVP